MRLLELKAHGEFSLTEFIGDNIPLYAILSHTWGADGEEVTFKDLVNHTGKSKAGYTKIEFCGEQASRDGLRYFWIDTCCIDKSSSAELTEAINSMFHWYRGAAKCYVYLSDVSIPGCDKIDHLPQLPWESTFRESRWFTRGWTLQELIAPKSVEFFSLEGKRLGDKKSLERQVHEITGIDIQALQGCPLSSFSVIERMSWAAKRKTTRKEDEAYSLLGIFDIHMPLIYGEGTKAYNRLKEEIDKSLKERPKTPPTPPTPPSTIPFRRNSNSVDRGAGNVHWKVPRATNSLFTGRTKILERVENIMRRDIPDQKRFIITGLGGLGKSEICLKIANEMRQEFWGVFWVDVSNPDMAKTSFIAVARMFGAEVDSVEDACGLLANRKQPWLLILDNADDPSFDYQIYIPSGTQGNIIMTSRFADCKHFSTVGWESLANLEREECQELLLKAAHIPKEYWKAHTDAAESVICLLESHTLAIIQAGAYIARGHCKLSDFPKIFHQQRRRLLEFRPTQAQSRYCDVYATFEASAEVLSDDALQLLGIISILHFSFLSVSVFESAWVGSQQVVHTAPESEDGLDDLPSWDVSQLPGVTDGSDNETGFDVLNDWHVSQLPAFIGTENNQWDSYRLGEAIYLLESLSLITTTEQDGVSGISMHPLAHAWAKDRQKPEAKEHSWVVAGSVVSLSVRGSATRMLLERHLRPHIQSYVDERTISNILCGFQRNMLALVWSSSWMLMRLREDSRLERLLHELFREAGLDPALPRRSLVPLYHLLAQSHYLSGHSKIAVNLMEQVVEIHRETLDETHRNRLASQHVLAVALRNNGQTKEAIKLLEHVVGIRKAKQAETHPSCIASQHELATAYEANGQIEEAIKLLEYVLNITVMTLNETHPDRLASQHNLARVYGKNRQIEEAVKLLEHVVKIEATTLAETHPDRLTSQHTLACTYENNGQTEEAVKLLEHIVKIEATTLAKTHPERLASQYALARAYEKNEQIEEAVKLLEYVVKIEATTLAETHPTQLASQHNLACAYEKNGQIEEAVKLLEHVVKIEATTLDETHPDRLLSQRALARVLDLLPTHLLQTN